MKQTIKKPKKFLLRFRLRPAIGCDALVQVWLEDRDSVSLKIDEAKRFYGERYICFELYRLEETDYES